MGFVLFVVSLYLNLRAIQELAICWTSSVNKLPDEPLPQPVFAGFFPKRVVDNVCSVSLCRSPGPADYIQHWTHNPLGFYDSAAAARQVIPAGDEHEYEMFAYRIFPVVFAEDGMHADPDLTPRPADPDSSGWQFVGYDLAGRWPGMVNAENASAFFEHSPLSCNAMADEFQTNASWLIEDLETAVAAGLQFGKEKIEEGRYWLFAVYRVTSLVAPPGTGPRVS